MSLFKLFLFYKQIYFTHIYNWGLDKKFLWTTKERYESKPGNRRKSLANAGIDYTLLDKNDAFKQIFNSFFYVPVVFFI